MNKQNKLAKSSALALALATLFAGSVQTSAAAQTSLLWAEHLKDACQTGDKISHASIRAPGFETDAKRSTLPIWAGHFKEAYTPSLERTEFASMVSRQSVPRVSPLLKTTAAC